MPELSSHSIWVDATGIVRWGPQAVTGVQRVELGLCEYALKNSDRIGICALDSATMRYVPADEKLRDYIRHILRLNRSSPDQAARSVRLRCFGLQLRFADNETARRLANTILGSEKRSGPNYAVAKALLRLFLWSYFLLRSIAYLPVLPVRLVTMLRGSRAVVNRFILVSHEVNRHPLIKQAVNSARAREANIIYDLIPVQRPELTSARLSRKMAGLVRRILTNGNEIIAISHATANDLKSADQTEVKSPGWYSLHVCPLNSSIRSDPEKDVPIPELVGKRFAMFCSTIDIRKGQWVLVAAWRRLAELQPPEKLPHLVLIGRKSSGMPDLERELSKAGPAGDKIHVLHNVKDAGLQWAYRHAVLTMFPSKAEGWGLGVSESLAHGVPVLHSDIPILHEAAQGLMPSAPVGDVDAWTSKLYDLFASPKKIEALAASIASEYTPGEPEDFARCVIARLEARLAQAQAAQPQKMRAE